MDTETVAAKLAEILADYQDPAQEPADPITPDVRPLCDIKGFDSHFIPEVVRLLLRAFRGQIPKGTRIRNVFVEKGKKLTVREIAGKFVAKYSLAGSKV